MSLYGSDESEESCFGVIRENEPAMPKTKYTVTNAAQKKEMTKLAIHGFK
jgi:hypothetical protein